jgi:hypothetical protein
MFAGDVLGASQVAMVRATFSTRSYDISEGRKQIAEAGGVLLHAGFSKEAILAAETFQSAAEAFIQYKEKHSRNLVPL